MSASFGSKRFWRRAGERIAEYCTKFDESVNQLRDDGIAFEALEPILGWFHLQMMALIAEQRERAVAA